MPTNGAYQTAELTFAGIENEHPITVQIKDKEGIVLKELIIVVSSAPQNISADLQTAKEVSISTEASVWANEKMFVAGSLKCN